MNVKMRLVSPATEKSENSSAEPTSCVYYEVVRFHCEYKRTVTFFVA